MAGLYLLGLRNQAITLKFRLLSISFTSARLHDECNGDFSPTVGKCRLRGNVVEYDSGTFSG